jgi:alpha-2-macroglobulin
MSLSAKTALRFFMAPLAALILACGLAACTGKAAAGRKGESPEEGARFAGLAEDARGSAKIDWSKLKGELSRQEALEGNLKKASIDLSQSSIEYYSKAAAGEGAALAPEEGDMVIVDHGPEGELPIEMRKPTIYVMFSHPVVPLAKLGEPITSSPIMKIVPEAKGKFRWYGTRVLSFEPDEQLISEPRYQVTISGSTRSLGGKKLGKDFTFEFFTEAVKIVNYYPGKSTETNGSTNEVPIEMARYAIVEFNQAVDPKVISKYLKVIVKDRDAGFSVSRPAYPAELKSRTQRALLLTLKSKPAEDSEVKIRLLDGAMPKKKYPARSGDQEQSYHTVTPFRSVELSASSYDMPRSNQPATIPVYARFSHDLDKSATGLPWSVTVNGSPIQPKALELFGSTLRIGLDSLEPKDTVMVSPPAAAKDVYGRSITNPDKVLSCQIPAPYAYVAFPERGLHQLEAAYPPKLIWEARDPDSLSIGKAGGDFLSNAFPAQKKVDASAWKPNRVHYEVEDLKPFMNKDGFGSALFSWTAKTSSDWGTHEEGESFAVQVTDIGITTRVAYNRVLVWANSLSTGKPVAGARAYLIGTGGPTGKEAKTDAAGFASIEIGDGEFERLFHTQYDDYYLVAAVEKGSDISELPVYNSHNSWTSTSYSHSNPIAVTRVGNRVMLFTDRGLYKGGEELALRGIHWKQNVSGYSPYSGDYRLNLNDPRTGELLWSKAGRTTESGGLAERFVLPSGLEPGEYRIEYSFDGMSEYDDPFNASFTIAAFRRLAFQVKSAVPERVFYSGDDAAVDVTASYLAGGAMGGAGYQYYWTASPTAFKPAGTVWKDFVFGPGTWEGERRLDSGEGKLSPSGSAALKVKTGLQDSDGSSYNFTVETTVQDIDRQAISSAATVLVHPASFYIGARFESGSKDGWWSRFVSTGKEVKLQAALVDPAGQAWAKDAKLKASIVHGTWKSIEQEGVYGRVNTRWDYVEDEIESANLSAKDGKASWSFKVKEGGDYFVQVEGKDQKGRLARTVLRFYATGSSWARRATETPTTIELIAEKELYMPGETAHIMVRSPLPSGKYLFTVEREGIQEEKIIDLSDGKNMIEVPITEAHVPVVYAALSSFTKREAPPADHDDPDLGRPRGLFGIVGLRVSTKPVELDVEVKALSGSYRPGSKAEVLVKVSRDGKPVVNGEVTLMAVDRGVLDLINYHVPDPIEHFYSPYAFPLGVDGDDSRRLLLKPVTYDTSVLTGGDGEKVNERKDFRPLALFEPFARTDANGEARVSFKLPDNLTTYRLTALALQDNRVGLKEGELLVQNPINVRTALPRRFRNRDTAAAGVILQNLTDDPQKVEVSVESTILAISGDKKRSIEVPPHGAYELPFILSGTKPGEGTITFTVHSAVVNEKLTEKVTVERPLVKEAFTTVGVIPRESAQAQEGLSLPSAISPGYGSLSIKASSTLKPYIEGALSNLLEPPEPWWSYYWWLTHGFAAIYARQGDGDIKGLLSELAARQQSDGGIYVGNYSWSPYVSDPFISVMTAWLMQFGESRKWNAPEAPDKERLLDYLSGLKGDKTRGLSDPCSQAWLAMVLAQSGRIDSSFLKELEKEEDKLGLGGYGYLAQAYLASGSKEAAMRVYKRSKNFILMGTQKIDVKETYEVTCYWSSELGELALMLKNATELGEDKDFLMRLAGSLNRSERYWQTRNDDLLTLLGFIPLLDTEGAAAGEATLAVKADGAPLCDMSLSAKAPESTKSFEFSAAPLSALPRDKILPLDFAKQGDTPLYYTSILRYALPTETAFARDEGIEVSMRYEDLDGKTVKEDALALGDTYRVRVNVSTSKRREKLDLLVPVPNGVEIVDPTFATTGKFANKGGTGGETIQRETVYGDEIEVTGEGYVEYDDYFWEWYYYYPDSFALDNMMVYRWTDFYAGSREITFLVRVTTPGIYPTPPAQASLEFEPEVFGRTEGKLFVIKP